MFDNIRYPIVIDQFYCPNNACKNHVRRGSLPNFLYFIPSCLRHVLLMTSFSHCLEILKSGTSALAISDVLYTRITGTSSGDEVISLNCGTRNSCNNIVLDDIHLKSSDPTKTAYAHCLNVNGRASNVEPSADQCMHSWATIDLELHRRKELFYFRTQFAHDICWMSLVVNLMLSLN